jgi:hypothetical protein
MPGVPRELAEHKLKVYPRRGRSDKNYVVSRPTREKPSVHSWLAWSRPDSLEKCYIPSGWQILFLYSKKNKVDWRMCIDYIDLNKHCLKDPFGLPRIDQVVDSTAGCSMLSFLDCYSGYHQISLAKEDEEKTAFITPFGAFCYTSMQFGLKNAGATYQRAIQTCLADH